MAKNKEEVQQNGTPEGWAEVKTDRPCWKPEKSKCSVKGILLGVADMPAGANGRPWQAFIVKLTAPCIAFDREDVEVECEEGTEILMPSTHQLSQHLFRPASHEKYAFEVYVEPRDKIKTRGGSMWRYKIAVNPKPILRSGEMRFLASASAKALPAHQAAEPGDDNIPF